MFVVECIVGGRLVRVLVRATDATDARGAAGRKLAMSDVRGAITITAVRRVEAERAPPLNVDRLAALTKI